MLLLPDSSAATRKADRAKGCDASMLAPRPLARRNCAGCAACPANAFRKGDRQQPCDRYVRLRLARRTICAGHSRPTGR